MFRIYFMSGLHDTVMDHYKISTRSHQDILTSHSTREARMTTYPQQVTAIITLSAVLPINLPKPAVAVAAMLGSVNGKMLGTQWPRSSKLAQVGCGTHLLWLNCVVDNQLYVSC